MDSQRFETLLNRLEGYVQGAENSIPKTPEQQLQKLEGLIERLEKASLAGGKIPAGTTQVVKDVKA